MASRSFRTDRHVWQILSVKVTLCVRNVLSENCQQRTVGSQLPKNAPSKSSSATRGRNPVRGLYSRLTQDGVDAWLDKAKLLPGQDWELEIRKAVRESIICA
jgi:hypothetical protein